MKFTLNTHDAPIFTSDGQLLLKIGKSAGTCAPMMCSDAPPSLVSVNAWLALVLPTAVAESCRSSARDRRSPRSATPPAELAARARDKLTAGGRACVNS